MVALLAFGRSVAVASEAHGMARLQKINTWTGLLDIIDDFADGRRVVLGSPSTPCGHGAAAGVGHRCTYFVPTFAIIDGASCYCNSQTKCYYLLASLYTINKYRSH